MMTPSLIHRAAHDELRRDFAKIGLELEDQIPLSWTECQEKVGGEAPAGLILWVFAIAHMAAVGKYHVLAEGAELLKQMLESKSPRRRSRAEAKQLSERFVGFSRQEARHRGRPSLRYAVEVGGVTVLADARSKSWGGMLRRYVLKGDPAVAQLDAMAAWLVLPEPEKDDGGRRDAAIRSWLEELDYRAVGHLKTSASSGAYGALTYQRERLAGDVMLGQEIKIFTPTQFRSAEVDPCSDSARRRYERRRLLELADQLGFPCTTFYFIRHGETHANAQGILHGSRSSSLTPRAESQARLRGIEFFLKNRVSPAVVLSSNSPRTLQTARLFTEKFRCPIEARSGLRERRLGRFEGQRRPAGFEGNKLFAKYGYDKAIPGNGEAFVTVEARSIATLEADAERWIGKSVVVFTHAGVLRALLGAIDGVPAELRWNLQSAPHLEPQVRHVPAGYSGFLSRDPEQPIDQPLARSVG